MGVVVYLQTTCGCCGVVQVYSHKQHVGVVVYLQTTCGCCVVTGVQSQGTCRVL